MPTCPNCNTANEDGSRFCSQCGTKLEQIRICPVCGEKLASNAKFCHGCGYNLNDRSENVGAKDNVFGGNVDGSFNTTNNYINTFRNESADIIECEVCGKMLSKGSGEAYKCRQCGKIYCSLHFDTEYNMCSVCAEEPRKAKEKSKTEPDIKPLSSSGAGFTVSSDWFFDGDEEEYDDSENDAYDGLEDGIFTAEQKKAMATILREDLEDAKIIESLCPEKIKTENVIVKKNEPKPQSKPCGKIIMLNGTDIPISGETVVLGSYKNNKSIVKVILPESIKSIPDGAFEGCNMLVEIEAPSVTWIGTRAFWGCISLKRAIFPKGITHMGVSAFECCYMLSEINLAKGLDLINNSAFKGCKMLSGISIPESVRGINDFAFTDCESLREIYLHNNASYIGKHAFACCKNLCAVRVADCKNDLLRSGKGLESIFSCAFMGCNNLKEINLPQSVRKIDDDAFKGCGELTFAVDPNNFFYGVKGNCLIAKDTETLLFANSHSAIPTDGSVKEFGKHCMVAQAGVKSVNIPHGVTNIGTEAFAGCTSLSSVSLPAGIKKLGWGLFFGCTALKEIVFDGTKAEWDAIEKSELGKSLTVYVKGLFGAKKAVRTHSEY